ncbi:MAG: hypothetical protein HY401_07415 [Elusimicrobia bacterium]|nr:hypothetical protein [Elusimicrobiota bacterium]
MKKFIAIVLIGLSSPIWAALEIPAGKVLSDNLTDGPFPLATLQRAFDHEKARLVDSRTQTRALSFRLNTLNPLSDPLVKTNRKPWTIAELAVTPFQPRPGAPAAWIESAVLTLSQKGQKTVVVKILPAKVDGHPDFLRFAVISEVGVSPNLRRALVRNNYHRFSYADIFYPAILNALRAVRWVKR